jgi:hypothetical protein
VGVVKMECEKMDEKTIIELLEKANYTEWKYLLTLHIYVGDSYEVLHGVADFVDVSKEDEEYLEKIVIPKTVPVILRHRHRHQETVYIFTNNGWKSVIV